MECSQAVFPVKRAPAVCIAAPDAIANTPSSSLLKNKSFFAMAWIVRSVPTCIAHHIPKRLSAAWPAAAWQRFQACGRLLRKEESRDI